MKRHSLKKASTFKLQGERSKFQSYLEDIENCPMVKKHPHMTDLIKETSQTVYSHCYTFRDDSPFCRGLNYGSKTMGFSFQDNVLSYKEWLPNISEVYVMGQFNQFNGTMHKMEKFEQDGQGWWKIQIDLTGSHIEDDGSKVMLRVIDHQGTELHMIPPSCHIISNGYGIIKKAQILPLSKKKLKIHELLAYTIDLNKLSLSECLELLQREQEIFESYNTIILKNLFKNNYGMLYRFSVEFNELEKIRQIVLKIKNQCGCKAVIQWNFEPGKMQYMKNPIQEKFLTQLSQGNYAFDFTNNQVMAFYLANASYFYQNLGIDGLHFTNIEHALKTKEGTIVLKCLNVLNSRIIDSGITLGSSKEKIDALTGEIIEGGCGFNFTYNHHESLALSQNHHKLFSTVSKVSEQSNCLAINFEDYDEADILNLIFTILFSNKGIFTRGDFSNLKSHLKKVLKLRCQDKLFDNEISRIKFSEQQNVVLLERGVSVIVFNFGDKQYDVEVQNCEDMEIIYTHNIEGQTEINQGKLKMMPKSCVLFENQTQDN